MFGCNKKDVTITKDYVLNPNWSEVDNSICVSKMQYKDSSKTFDLIEPSIIELRYDLITDTSFSYMAKVVYNGVDYAERKVYFNRDNGFPWSNLNNRHSNCKKEILGELQPNTWYSLTMSNKGTYYYLFLDTSDSLHVFEVNSMTNY